MEQIKQKQQAQEPANPEKYQFNKAAYLESNLKIEEDSYYNHQRIGLMAQDVEEIMPDLVMPYKDDYKTYNKEALVNVLINAVKELSAKNDALEARIAALEG